MANTYDDTVTEPRDLVRLLVNDVAAPWVFTDAEIAAFLTLEAGSVKRAAASAIYTNAGNELLASKVITTEDGASTSGDRLATAMRALADSLRAQADADEDGYVDIADVIPGCAEPELSGWPAARWVW